MFKTMRRFKQKLSEEKCIEILTNEPHGVLSLISDTGYPMVFLLHIGTMKKTDTSIFMEQKKDIKWIV